MVMLLCRDDTISHMRAKLAAADSTVCVLTAEQKDYMQQLLVRHWHRYSTP